MVNREAVESREQLMAVARELGVSERQVRRWRGQGLLPKHVDQEWRGRGRGSATFYPPGSCRQLREVSRWFERDRRVDVVRWVLWCNGFAVEPDLHELILARLRRRRGRGARGGDENDFVGRFAEMLRAAADAAKRLDPAEVKDLGSLLSRIAPRRASESIPSLGERLPGELDLLVRGALADVAASDLERYLTPERLTFLRERAALFYRLWAPERAATEPLPPRVLVTLIVLNSIGIPIGVVVDYLLHHPSEAEAGRKLRDWLLDDSVWRKPHRRHATTGARGATG